MDRRIFHPFHRSLDDDVGTRISKSAQASGDALKSGDNGRLAAGLIKRARPRNSFNRKGKQFAKIDNRRLDGLNFGIQFHFDSPSSCGVTTIAEARSVTSAPGGSADLEPRDILAWSAMCIGLALAAAGMVLR